MVFSILLKVLVLLKVLIPLCTRTPNAVLASSAGIDSIVDLNSEFRMASRFFYRYWFQCSLEKNNICKKDNKVGF